MPSKGQNSHYQLLNVVVEQIRAAILERHYPPGTWLRQEHIAHELSVSQMPVREALKQLATMGLVEHLPYRGVRVVEFSAEDVEDLYALRAFLESRAAGVAAKNITKAEIAQLGQIQQEIQATGEPEDINRYRELNRRFHEMIYTASRRPYLIRNLNHLWTTFPTMLIGNFSRTASSPLEGRETDNLEHTAILKALEQSDESAARQAMQSHIESVAREFVGALDNV